MLEAKNDLKNRKIYLRLPSFYRKETRRLGANFSVPYKNRQVGAFLKIYHRKVLQIGYRRKVVYGVGEKKIGKPGGRRDV